MWLQSSRWSRTQARLIAGILLILTISISGSKNVLGSNPSKTLPFQIRGGETPESLSDLVNEAIEAERKILVVTGGVLSGIGKGVVASSVGVLLRAMGLRVTALKIDPYLNVDAGTMSPFEHGEVFVLDDGGETDLDLGNYERFLSVSLTKDSNLSTGKIYQVSFYNYYILCMICYEGSLL